MLDRTGEPWVGKFPGLGTVSVHADGSFDVVAEPDHSERAEEIGRREDALRYGWAEPLSFVRRGYRCAWGTALAVPGGDTGILLQGDPHGVGVGVVFAELVGLGWRLISDRIVPTQWVEGQLLAFPRDAPALLSRQCVDSAGLDGVEVRAHTDAVAVDVDRVSRPIAVSALVTVDVRRPGDPVVEALSGHERFRIAASVMITGVMAVERVEPHDGASDVVLREHLDMAALPFVRLRYEEDSVGVDVAELCAWMATAAPVPGAAR
jgi:hypothetical protein